MIKEYIDFNEKEILNLYSSVNWNAYTTDLASLKKGFANSLLVLGAYEDDLLVGLIRVVGDASTIIFIQDLLVHPHYQHKNIGKSLVDEVLNRYKDVRQIELITDKEEKSISFYKKLGFKELDKVNLTGFIKIK